MLTKPKIQTTIFTVIALLLVLSLHLPAQNTVNAFPIFDDDFTDGNYDGWTISGAIFNGTNERHYPLPGNFTAADGTLKATGPVGNSTWPQLSWASVVNPLAYGNWSFDLLIVDNPYGVIVVQFIADAMGPPQSVSAFPTANVTADYELVFLTHAVSGLSDRPTIFLFRYSNLDWTELDEYAVGPSLGIWSNALNHVEITRNITTGHFNIYLNGTLTLEATDNQVTTSSYFNFIAQNGQAIDNVIFDTGDIIPLPPEIPGFPLTALVIGLTLSLGLIVMLRRRRS